MGAGRESERWPWGSSQQEASRYGLAVLSLLHERFFKMVMTEGQGIFFMLVVEGPPYLELTPKSGLLEVVLRLRFLSSSFCCLRPSPHPHSHYS